MLTYFLGNKGKDLESLLKSSVVLFGEGQVLTPSLNRLILSAFNHLFTFAGVYLVCYRPHSGVGVALLATALLLMFPYSFFYHVRMKACQTWMVYTTITKNSSSMQEAQQATRQVKWSLRFLALIEFIIATPRNQESEKERQQFSLTRLVISALETVFDVAEDFLLPAVVIEQKSLREVVPKLEQLKTNIPASLAGAFGLDIFGNAIGAFTFLIHAAIFLTGVLIGLVAAHFVPALYLTPMPQDFRNSLPWLPSHFYLAPVIAALFLSSYLNRALKISVSSIKDTYFSVFYTSINRPLEIRENLRENLTNFLNVGDQSYVPGIKAMVARKFPELAKGPTEVRAAEPQQVQAVETFFQENIGKHSLERIHDYLLTKGYREEQILPVMAKYKKPA